MPRLSLSFRPFLFSIPNRMQSGGRGNNKLMKITSYLQKIVFLATIGISSLWADSQSGGNFTVNATTTEPGDLTVEGNAHVNGSFDLGTTATSQSAILFNYTENSTVGLLDITATQPATAFLWQDNAIGTSRPKMELGTSNILSLYNPATGNATITLNPESGRLALSGAGSGIVLSDNTVIGSGTDLQSKSLYDNNGVARITFDANGNMIVSAPASFQQGITVDDILKFGNGTQLDATRAENLVKVLQNLGYSDNPSTAWTSKFGMTASSGAFYISKVAITASGSIWVTGTFTGTLTVLRYSYGYTHTYTAKGSRDVFVAQLDPLHPSFSVSNFYVLDGTGEETVKDIAFGPWNQPCIVGTFKGTLKPSSGSSISSTGTTSDVYAAMPSYPGWIRRIGTDAADDVASVGIDSNNGLYVGGTYSATLSYGGTSSLNSTGSTDGYLIKLNVTNGNPVWAKSIGGTGADSLHDLSVDLNSGTLFITGIFSGTVSFGAAGNLVNTGSQDIYLAKLDASGNFAWSRQLSSTGNFPSYQNALACDAGGNVFYTGAFRGTATFENISNPPAPLTSGFDYDGNQRTEVMFSKLSTSGSVEWFKKFGEDNTNYPEEIAISTSGNVYIMGQMDWYYYEDAGSDPFLAMVDGTTGAVSFEKYYAGEGSWLTTLATGGGKLALGTFFTEKKSLDGKLLPTGPALFVSNEEGIPTMAYNTPAISFSWGTSQGTDGATALGNQAYAISSGAVATGAGTSSAQYSFSAGSGSAESDYAAAIGYGSKALGLYSVALGSGYASGQSALAGGASQASGDYSTAWGGSSKASASYSLAAGYATTASGDYSTAFGYRTLASGAYSCAIGSEAKATGSGAMALGMGTEASGESSMAFGKGKASARASTAFGEGTLASGWGSTAWGNSTTATGEHSTAIGRNTSAPAWASLVVGSYNIPEGTAFEWIETDPAFVVGNGRVVYHDNGEDYWTETVRSNAFVVRKNGNVEIAGKIKMPRQGDILMGEFGNGD